MRAFPALFAMLLLPGLVACASPRQSAPLSNAPDMEVNPIGVYRYQMAYNDPIARRTEMVSGNIVIQGQGDGYGGEVTASGRSALPITYVQTSRGNELLVQVRGEEGPITLNLVFVGDTFRGQWVESNNLAHQLSGTRR
jgi:hypothetical protein